MGQIVTFFGSDSQVGTTMIAQSVAEALGSQGKHVLFIFASGERDDNFIQGVSHGSIDDIRRVQNLTINDVNALITSAGTFDYIEGVRNQMNVPYFAPDLITQMASLLDKKYDYVIIDGGHNVQYPLPISALLAASKRYFVMTQNGKSVRRFKQVMEDVLSALNVYADEDKIIVNKFNKSGIYYTQDQIDKMFPKEKFQVPMIDMGQGCEMDKKTLMKSGAFAKAIHTIVLDVCGEKPQKKGLFG